ncbi:MAG TPA: Zn-dependent hydrolase [Candidatus Limnocylindrales bacterium]|nr:Zn-dependent hydrolase [Candidatus Limnocylindrales bacterium]
MRTKGPSTAAESGAGATGSGGPGLPSEPVRADAVRIGEMLAQIARIGANPDGSISRISFTAAERQAHELVGGWLRELGLAVRTDAIGNTIAERPGADGRQGAIGVGSHLDSVPHGGRFDGIVGVVGAVELVRILADNGTSTRHPVRVVIFAGEEGARFGEPCIGSKAVAGDLANRDLGRMRDADGVSLAKALRTLGMDPAAVPGAAWRPDDWAAFMELHIEQARSLELEGLPIGLVDTVSGSTRLRLRIEGRADHSGGTPMDIRQDALAAAAEVVLAAERLAREPHNRGARLTVGRLDVRPNSITTIPGEVILTIDIRDVDSDRQRGLAVEIVRLARAHGERRGVAVDVELIADTSPVVLPMWIRELTSRVCHELDVGYRVMTSGAGHDSQVVNAVVPAGMIFVPSRDGLSHVPEEWTSASDVARGVDVLTRSVLRLDELLGSLEAIEEAGGAA